MKRVAIAFFLIVGNLGASPAPEARKGPGFLKRVAFEASLHWTKMTGQDWWNPIGDTGIIVGALPLASHKHHVRLARLGVNTVLSMVEPFEQVSAVTHSPVTPKMWAKLGVKFYSVPARDFRGVRVREFTRAIEVLDAQLKAGKRVYVHCKAGRGRSASVVVAYLVQKRNMSFEQAYALVRSHRSVVRLNPRQAKAVQAYLKSVGQGASCPAMG